MAILAGVSIGGLLAVFMIVAPDQGSSVGAHFDYLGIDSFSQIPGAMLQQPGEVLRQILNPIFVMSIVMWLVTIGLVLPLRSPQWFLIGVPMLLVAAIGSPAYADLWFQHYWNFLLVGAAVAFVLSLKVWSFSSTFANILVVVVLVVAWIVPGSLLLRPELIDPFYPPASASDHQAAAISSSAPGALSTLSKLVPQGAHREWVYNFPNPFVCHADQYAYFKLSGPAPDVVITKLGWEETVDPRDIAGLRQTLASDYEVTDRIGNYSVRELVPARRPGS